MRFKQLCLLWSVILWSTAIGAFGQTADTIPKAARSGLMDRIREFAKTEAQESMDDVEEDRAVITQYRVLEQIKGNMQKAKLYLRNGIDTSAIKQELKAVQKDIIIAGDGVFTNTGTAQTFRNLSATSKILTELYNKVRASKTRLETYNDALNNYHFQLDSLSATPALFKFSKDSIGAVSYLKQLVTVAREIKPIDDSLKKASSNILALLNELSITTLDLQNSIDLVADYHSEMAHKTFERDFNSMWESIGYNRPFKDIVDYSLKKDLLTLKFYVQENQGKTGVLLVMILVCFTYLRSLKRIYMENGLLEADFKDQVVLRYPLLSAIVIISNLFQFVFISPPFLWSLIWWTISAIALSLLFHSFITRYWMRVWLMQFFLFMIASADNLILQASRTERWLLLVLSVTGAVIGVIVYLTGNKQTLRERWMVHVVGLMAIFEIASTLANLFGRYNLAKSFAISGFLNVVVAVMFLWTVRLINEGMLLAFNIYRQHDKKLFYLNYSKIGEKAPGFFYVLLVVGWGILVGRNFPAFEYLAMPVSSFFSSEHTLGQYTFTINSILLFIFIIGCSVLISKIVSFFASDQYKSTDSRSSQAEKRGLGSWLLLVRISILSIGLFLAVAASGIPVDRIAIVLGALGVGIGFGLQTLVNNLVSGLIIAFEKPVNVGDRVDVDGQSGTMKSIGFRSSIITTWDGADVVMPNGDLLNSHLINWTMAGNKKRGSILIGVDMDSDMDKAKALLDELLAAEERLAKNPKYVIQYEQFTDSAIELRVYFWTKHIGDLAATRSDMIVAINNAFKKNGIAIPYPRQDVHIYRD
jgi:potassium efflux system protein